MHRNYYTMKNKTIKTDPRKLAKALQAYENKWLTFPYRDFSKYGC